MRSANCIGVVSQAVLPRSRECSRRYRIARALVLNRRNGDSDVFGARPARLRPGLTLPGCELRLMVVTRPLDNSSGGSDDRRWPARPLRPDLLAEAPRLRRNAERAHSQLAPSVMHPVHRYHD